LFFLSLDREKPGRLAKCSHPGKGIGREVQKWSRASLIISLRGEINLPQTINRIYIAC